MEPTKDIIGSAEEFQGYRVQMEARLAARRQERASFLQGVISDLEAFLREAKLLDDREAEQELTERLQSAREQMALLNGTPASTNGKASAAPAVPAAPAANGTPAREPLPPAPPPAPAPLPAAVASPAPAPAPRPPAEPPPFAVRAAPTPVFIPPPVRKRTWEPRPVQEIDAQVTRLEEQLDAEPGEGAVGLLGLKALTCRQRRAFWELEDQGAYAGQARALYGKLKARVHALFGERRVLPLNTNVTPAEPVRWEDLARGYEALARAVDAFDWYRQEADTLGPAAARELLESIGAVQQQFYRLLESQFKGAADDQQRGLYEALLAAAEEQQIFLDSLNPRRTEEELRELAEVLPKIRQRLREGVAKKELQQQAVGRVLDLTDRADFGALDTDPSDLRDAAVACLKAGVPASNRSLRDALLPWTVLIDEEPQLANLVKEIDRELERRDKRDHPEETGDEDAGAEALSPEIQAMLQELLPHTRGKRCFFIGGDTREEKRRQLQAVLELEELVWPAARPTASVYDFEPEIARCDIIALLIRFMRTGFKQAVDLCRVHNTRVVRVPRGLGLTRIITDFHQQLVPRSDSDTGGS